MPDRRKNDAAVLLQGQKCSLRPLTTVPKHVSLITLCESCPSPRNREADSGSDNLLFTKAGKNHVCVASYTTCEAIMIIDADACPV